MRQLILILVLCASALGQVVVSGKATIPGRVDIFTYIATPPTAACAGYALDIPVTLVKASSSDQTNFPVRVIGRDFRLASVANGGNVQNSTTNSVGRTAPADLVFATTTLTSTALKHETVYWDATTGDYEFWVQQPTYHTASNDTIHLCVNNASVTTSQDDLSLWADVNYVGVWHFPRGSVYTAPDLKNSVTGTAATATNVVNQNYGSSGDGVFTDATGNVTPNYLTVADAAPFHPAALTLEAYGWAHSYHDNALISKPDGATWVPPFVDYRLGTLDSSGPKVRFDINVGGTQFTALGTSSLPAMSYFQAAGTFDGSNLKVYRDGALEGTTAQTGAIVYGSQPIGIATSSTTSSFSSFDYWNGMLDEIRVASAAKTANWLASAAKNGDPYISNARPTYATYTKPIPIQKTGCSADSPGATTCTFNFDVNPDARGGVMVVHMRQLGTGSGAYCLTGRITDTLGLTYTAQAGGAVSGHIETYSNCIYTASIPSGTSGTDTLTVASSSRDVGLTAWEVPAGTETGLSATSSVVDQPATMTASCSTTNCIVFCGTAALYFRTDLLTSITVSPSSYRLEQGIAFNDAEDAPDSHPLYGDEAWGWVGSGSHTCSFSSGIGGVMVTIPYAP